MPFFAVKIALMKWLQYVIVILFVGGLTYCGLQQMYRQGANDPQIQVVEDVALIIASGVDVAQIIPSPNSDAAISLAPFIAQFKEDGSMLRSSAVIKGEMRAVPIRVLAQATLAGENRVTWEPLERVRVALVVKPLADGTYIASGRNMREVENRIRGLTYTALSMLSLALFLTLLLELFGAWRHSRAKKGPPPPAPTVPEVH